MLKHLSIFFCLGALLFIILPIIEQWQKKDDTTIIAISADDQQRQANYFISTYKRAPNFAEMSHLIQQLKQDHMLFQEALRLNLHLHDSVVQQRLIKNMLFLGQQQPEQSQPIIDEQALFEQALALNMHLNDIVVKRRLIERMQKIIYQQLITKPSDADLQDYLQSHLEEYPLSMRYRIAHYFFEKPHFQQQPMQQLYLKWQSQQLNPLELQQQASNSFMSNHQPLSRHNLEKIVGQTLSEKIMTLEPGQYLPLYETNNGFHFLKLINKEKDQQHNFQTLKGQLLMDYQDQARDKALQQTFEELAIYYQFDIASTQ